MKGHHPGPVVITDPAWRTVPHHVGDGDRLDLEGEDIEAVDTDGTAAIGEPGIGGARVPAGSMTATQEVAQLVGHRMGRPSLRVPSDRGAGAATDVSHPRDSAAVAGLHHAEVVAGAPFDPAER